MIYVSQGHQEGVGLEIFFKSIICFNQRYIDEFILYANKESIRKTLKSINLDFNIQDQSIQICSKNLKCIFTSNKPTETLDSLNSILKIIKPTDVLLTLPSSKDQMKSDHFQCNGYTEYLRHYYNKELTMNFVSIDENVLLLTDHISIQEVSPKLTKEYILSQIKVSLSQFPKSVENVYLSGINPHAGEGGLISTQDSILDDVLTELKSDFPRIKFSGPLPSDTIHVSKSFHQNELTVYCYHDQGLNPFKLRNGFTGINLTLGLPFKRVSVDHGTAFNLFGKNKANYQGMLYLLSEIKNWT